jgi:pseudaminic acid synthase
MSIKKMVADIEAAIKIKGKVDYSSDRKREKRLQIRKSLFESKSMKKGDVFTEEKRSFGTPRQRTQAKYYKDVLGKSQL